MKTFKVMSAGLAAGVSAVLVLGGVAVASDKSATTPSLSSSVASNGGSVTVDTASTPNSLDPQEGYTTSAGEADWIVYTPLLTYAHKSGLAGTTIIPGLATSLPQISADGRTYNLTLRKGLKYSNGPR